MGEPSWKIYPGDQKDISFFGWEHSATGEDDGSIIFYLYFVIEKPKPITHTKNNNPLKDKISYRWNKGYN